MAIGTIAALSAGPAIASLFGRKKRTSQVPLETPEQRAARQNLLRFSDTGSFGDFEAGEELPLGYGDYGMTGIEEQGLSGLQGLLRSGIPSQYNLGDEAISSFLNPDPAAVQSQFEPFKAKTERQIRESNEALKRNAAFMGNLYSTDTIEKLGDIQARGNETLTSELARLTNEVLNRRLQAIPLAYQSGAMQEDVAQGRLDSAFRYGGLTRALNDKAIKERDAEILRRRQELQLPIQAAQTVAGQTANFGIPEVKTSPYQEFLGMVGNIGGQYLGNELFMNQYAKYFPRTA